MSLYGRGMRFAPSLQCIRIRVAFAECGKLHPLNNKGRHFQRARETENIQQNKIKRTKKKHTHTTQQQRKICQSKVNERDRSKRMYQQNERSVLYVEQVDEQIIGRFALRYESRHLSATHQHFITLLFISIRCFADFPASENHSSLALVDRIYRPLPIYITKDACSPEFIHFYCD